MASSLNIKDLQKEVAIRQQRANEVYDKILGLVHKKIIVTNDKSDDYSCIYKLPNFMYGYPIYNSQKCMEYLMTKLTNNGFEVRYIDANSIFISWRPKAPVVLPTHLTSSSRTPPAIQYNPFDFQPYPDCRGTSPTNVACFSRPTATTSKKSEKYDVSNNYSSYSLQYPQGQMIENNIRSFTTHNNGKKDKNKMDIKFVDMATFQPSNEIPF